MGVHNPNDGDIVVNSETPVERVGELVAEWLDSNWSLEITLAEWWSRLARAGFSQPTWPTGVGGLGASVAQGRAVMQSLAQRGVIAPPTGNGPAMGGPTVIAHGTPDQRTRFVLPLATGRSAWCQLFSEPGAGSDLASLGTRAERDGDEFVINGQKVWNSAADVSDLGMLLARTDADVPKHRGISFIMIDMNQPGVEVRPLVQMNGASEFCEVFFTDARARVADVIGDLHDGWKVARTTLLFERANAGGSKTRGVVTVTAGPGGGNLDRTTGELLAEARESAAKSPRDSHRRGEVLLNSRAMIKLARDLGRHEEPIVRQKLMRYFLDSEVYRLNNQRSRDLSRTKQAGPDGSMLKLQLALLAHHSRDLSLDLLGAEGTVAGPDSREGGRYVHTALSSPIPSLGGGTNEIQRNIIGERNLGLPREPSNDSEVPFRELRRSS